MIYFIEIFKSTKNNQFYFRGKAKNNKVVFQSEGYISFRNVLRAVKPLAAQLRCFYVYNYKANG